MSYSYLTKGIPYQVLYIFPKSVTILVWERTKQKKRRNKAWFPPSIRLFHDNSTKKPVFSVGKQTVMHNWAQPLKATFRDSFGKQLRNQSAVIQSYTIAY